MHAMKLICNQIQPCNEYHHIKLQCIMYDQQRACNQQQLAGMPRSIRFFVEIMESVLVKHWIGLTMGQGGLGSRHVMSQGLGRIAKGS